MIETMEYHIDEMFITSWSQLKADEASILLAHKLKYDAAKKNGRHKESGQERYLIAKMLCKKPKLFKHLSAEQLWSIVEDLTFLNEPFYDFHVTWIKAKGKKLIAPDEKLSSFTFWQLCKADAAYSKFLVQTYSGEKGQFKTMDQFISILYQPERKKFSEDIIEITSENLPRGLTPDLKFLILHTYGHCRRYIMKRCPNLFRADSGSGPATPTYTGKMWQDLLFDLSETNAFRGLDKAKNAMVYDALDYLELRATQAVNKKN